MRENGTIDSSKHSHIKPPAKKPECEIANTPYLKVVGISAKVVIRGPANPRMEWCETVRIMLIRTENPREKGHGETYGMKQDAYNVYLVISVHPDKR